MRAHWRFLVSVALLGGTVLLLRARNGAEILPPRSPLGSFPRTLGPWTSTDIPVAQDVREVLGPGDFLLRSYNLAEGGGVDLFIAYFPSQRTGDTIHSPKNCLPGSGWTPVRSDRVTIAVPGQAPFLVNRYVIAQAQQRQLVLYWYWAHNRAVASEYAAKFYLISDSIRMHRTDGSLVRLTTPIAENQSIESAQETLLSFSSQVVPLLNTYVPR